MSKFFKIFVGLVVFSTSVYAQDTLWARTYGDTANDEGHSVQECSSGGFIITGETKSFGDTLGDVYLIRTDSLGDTLWTKTYGGAYEDVGYSVQECSSGGFIITGSTGSFGGDGYNVYLIRTDTNGDTLWTKTYGGFSWDGGYSVQECSSGGFIITGYTSSFGAGDWDVYLIRTDANGDTLWTKTYGGTNDDEGESVQECLSGGFIITGWTRSFGAGGRDVYLIRTDSLGDTLWTKTYGGTDDDYGYSVQECSSGGFIITGYTWSFGSGLYAVYLIRTDTNGDTLWTKTYGGTGHERGYSVQECSSGGFIITGYTSSFGAGRDDVYLIRVSESGGVGEEHQKSEIQHPKLQVYPNPVFGNTVIRYGVPVKSKVSLSIYDLTGRLVKTLVDGEKDAGYYSVRWDANALALGIYFIKFKTDNYEDTKKIVLMK